MEGMEEGNRKDMKGTSVIGRRVKGFTRVGNSVMR
jgi:hypothetical protein